MENNKKYFKLKGVNNLKALKSNNETEKVQHVLRVQFNEAKEKQ